jgi:hypothetical protein
VKDSEILVAPKMSKFEWDMYRYKLSADKVLKKYERDGVEINRVMNSHMRQKEAFEKLKKYLKRAKFLERNEVCASRIARAKLVISLGGDNHFQYVSHFVRDTLLVGINSDPRRSEGCLTPSTVESFEDLAEKVLKDRYDVEEWTRMMVTINGHRIRSLAVSEIFIGEHLRSNMSRHRLTHNQYHEEQKCSGLIISTGSGSTGWYDSACRYIFPRGNKFKRTDRFFNFIATEPYSGKLAKPKHLHGTVKAKQKLIIHSLNDSEGILTIDSQEKHAFHEGSVAEIVMGRPLRILKA